MFSGRVVTLLDTVYSGARGRKDVMPVFSGYKILYLNKLAGYLYQNVISAYRATRCNNPEDQNRKT